MASRRILDNIYEGLTTFDPATAEVVSELAESGTTSDDGLTYIFSVWWYSVFPGLTIMLVVLALNFVGDALRDALAVEEH